MTAARLAQRRQALARGAKRHHIHSAPMGANQTKGAELAEGADLPKGARGAEMVAMMASLLALNALAIDIMLPAMGRIASDLGASGNDQQLIIVAYVLGFGAPQMVFGPVSDWSGRRRVIFVSLVGYVIAGGLCALAGSLAMLLAMRFTQGVFAAGCRVVAIAIVRDRFEGRAMARTMSLIMTVFMVVPIVAPAIGQGIIALTHWRACFFFLSFAAGLVLLWTYFRLGESLPVERRRPLSIVGALRAYKQVFETRITRGYMIASGLIFGALFAFLSAAEQIFREVFHRGDSFAAWFALVALTLSGANFLNARLVERFGMRRMSHAAMLGFTFFSGVLFALMNWIPTFAVFIPLFALCFAFFGLIGANFNAMAMAPLGRIAGTASAAYGFATTTVSGVIGGLIARQYDGTVLPLVGGYFVLGLVATFAVLVTERFRLFGDGAAGDGAPSGASAGDGSSVGPTPAVTETNSASV